MQDITSEHNFIDFLKHCEKLNIQFSMHENNLKVKLPSNLVPTELLEQLKFHKQTIIQFISESTSLKHDSDISTIQSADNQVSGPLSGLQRSMWYANKFSTNKGLLSYYASTHIVGNLDLEALSLAIHACLIKHPALRILISEDSEGNPTQTISNITSNPIKVVDCQNREEITQKQRSDFIENGFNLEHEIKLKSILLQLGANEFEFIVGVHHCVTDGWSIDLIMKDLSQFYNQFILTRSFNIESQIPSSPTWLDYVNWIEYQQKSPSWQAAKTYWSQRIQDAPHVHNLPLDRIRPSIQSFRTQRIIRKYSSVLYKELNALALTEHTSNYIVLLSVFSLLINKLSGETDILIGTSVANRPREEFSKIVGLFTNVLCMRIQHQPNMNFSQLLRQTHQHFIQDMEYQFLPLEEVVSLHNNSERNLSYSPLVQILFILQNNEFSGLKLNSTNCVTSHLTSNQSQYDLAISGLETEEGIALYWDFAEDIFTEKSIIQFSMYFENLLTEVVSNPNLPLPEYSPIDKTTQHELTYIHGGLQQYLETTHERESKFLNFLTQFEKIALLYPDKTAVTYKHQSIDYKTLANKASQLSSYLMSLSEFDVRTPIALCVPPSINLFITIIAVLQSGACFVPLDSEYPLARIGDCIQQADVGILLFDGNNAADLQKLSDSHPELHLIDINDQNIKKTQITCLEGQSKSIDPESVAYIIFTSGSTGKPKGVMVSHWALGNFCTMQSKYTAVTRESKILQMASISFDAAIYEMVMAFTSGAALIIAHKEILKAPTQLNDFVHEHQITHSSIPPALLSVLDIEKWKSVKLIFLGGEKCPLDLLHTWSQGRQLYHAYGPTESTVFVTAVSCNDNMLSAHIGKVVETSYCYILDRDLQPVPPNVIGELCIGGDTLAKGYINNDQQTRSCFIQDPILKDKNKRVYRTGDLVKWRDDGNIDFIGRNDKQVKIRGYRIELDEIQTLLLNHPQIKDAVVTTNSINSSNIQIIAYVVPADNYSKENVTGYLYQHLPSYMIPAFIVDIPEIPLTSNKKVNFSALQLPIQEASIETRKKSKTEITLTNLWEDELAIKNIGLHQNFFSIGGNSLAISRIATKTNKIFSMTFPISLFIEYQTIAELSANIDAFRENTVINLNPIFSIKDAHKNLDNIETLEI